MYKIIGIVVLSIGVIQQALGNVNHHPIPIDHKLIYCSDLYNISISLESQKKYFLAQMDNDETVMIVAESNFTLKDQSLNKLRYFWHENMANEIFIIQSYLTKQMADLHCFES